MTKKKAYAYNPLVSYKRDNSSKDLFVRKTYTNYNQLYLDLKANAREAHKKLKIHPSTLYGRRLDKGRQHALDHAKAMLKLSISEDQIGETNDLK